MMRMSNQKSTAIADLRQDYRNGTLEIADVAADPIVQFQAWFQAAQASKVLEPNAMTLATVSQNRPSARIVLLKGVDERGFSFFTNYNSRKGKEMAETPFASLTFWWGELERQIRIEGKVEKLPEAESDAYFQSRPRGSRLGAWASPQSEPISNREVLAGNVEALMQQYGEDESVPVPRPGHWGGYLVKPVYIEFWQGRSSRLHDRVAYSLEAEGKWKISRLAP